MKSPGRKPQKRPLSSGRIDKACNGDRSALASLFESALLPLQDLARDLVGERLRAKVRTSDLVQSTFAEAIDSLGSFRGSTEAEFFQWMRRILENNLRDKHRYYSTKRRDYGRERQDGETGLSGAVDGAALPSENASQRDELEWLTKCVGCLPRDQRRVLLLHVGRGLSHDEIAKRIGRSPGACRVLLSRARSRLMVEFAKAENEE